MNAAENSTIYSTDLALSKKPSRFSFHAGNLLMGLSLVVLLSSCTTERRKTKTAAATTAEAAKTAAEAEAAKTEETRKAQLIKAKADADKIKAAAAADLKTTEAAIEKATAESLDLAKQLDAAKSQQTQAQAKTTIPSSTATEAKRTSYVPDPPPKTDQVPANSSKPVATKTKEKAVESKSSAKGAGSNSKSTRKSQDKVGANAKSGEALGPLSPATELSSKGEVLLISSGYTDQSKKCSLSATKDSEGHVVLLAKVDGKTISFVTSSSAQFVGQFIDALAKSGRTRDNSTRLNSNWTEGHGGLLSSKISYIRNISKGSRIEFWIDSIYRGAMGTKDAETASKQAEAFRVEAFDGKDYDIGSGFADGKNFLLTSGIALRFPNNMAEIQATDSRVSEFTVRYPKMSLKTWLASPPSKLLRETSPQMSTCISASSATGPAPKVAATPATPAGTETSPTNAAKPQNQPQAAIGGFSGGSAN